MRDVDMRGTLSLLSKLTLHRAETCEDDKENREEVEELHGFLWLLLCGSRGQRTDFYSWKVFCVIPNQQLGRS